MCQSKEKKVRLTGKNFDLRYSHDYSLAFLALYHEKCKLKYSLAFIQHRRKVPEQDHKELNELFESRKTYSH